MFKFLKKIFAEKEQEKAELRPEQLEQWFEKKTKNVFDDLNSRIKEKISELNSEMKSLKEKTDKLESTEITDSEKIQSRVKNIVLSHRNNYLRMLNQFTDRIKPNAKDYKEALEFCNMMEKELDVLGKGSAKSHYTTQHLFSEQVGAVATSLRNMSSIIKSIRHLAEDANTSDIEKTMLKIKELNDSIKKKQMLAEKIDETKKKLTDMDEAAKKIESKKAELVQGEDYKEYNSLKEKIAEIEDDMAGISSKITDLFAPLESSLKKFQRVTFENVKLAEKYAADPLSSLFEDKELKIIELLANMRKSIDSNSIELNEKKKDRVIEQLRLITKEGLQRILEQYDELNKQKDEAKVKLKSINALNQIKQLDYKIDFYKQKKYLLEKDLESLESNRERIDIDKLKTDISGLIKRVTDIEVTISS